MQGFLVVRRSAVTRMVHAEGAVTVRKGAQAETPVLLPAEDWKQQQG